MRFVFQMLVFPIENKINISEKNTWMDDHGGKFFTKSSASSRMSLFYYGDEICKIIFC